MPANCYTVDYNQQCAGIALREDVGPDLLRPRSPAIYAGLRFLPVDYRDGAIVHHDSDGAFIHRANLNQFDTPQGSTIKTLVRPSTDKGDEVLVMTNSAMPTGHFLRPMAGQDGKAYSLNIQRGLHHNGQVLLADRDVAVIRLEVGQHVYLLFPDGLVRKFVAHVGGVLSEETLLLRQMALVRVEDAKKRLLNLMKKDVYVVDDAKHVLSGMVDLFHRLRGDSHESARQVICNFFFKEIDDESLSLIHRKLTAVLHAVDPVMAHALNAPEKTDATPVNAEKSAQAAAKRAATEARRAALRAKRDADCRDRKGSGTGGGKPKRK